MTITSELTMIRASKQARKRIDRLASRLGSTKGGRWSRPTVIDQALDALEATLTPAQAVANLTQSSTAEKQEKNL